MTQAHVELLTGGLDPRTIQQLTTRSIGSIDEIMESALISHRLMAMTQAKEQLGPIKTVTGKKLANLLNGSAEVAMLRFTGILGPAIAQTYREVYGNLGLDDIPVATLYALGEKHAERIGRYYATTSTEATIRGFNAMVNRNVPAKVAADRAVDAYGLTPKQMSGLVALNPPNKVSSARPPTLKARLTGYINSSIRQRLKLFVKQEVFNVEQQAKQAAWMYMQSTGVLTENAQKVWLTAKDERTCKICAPMHGKKAQITDQFTLPNGIKTWVSGVHPNCRCEVRVTDTGITKQAPAKPWYATEEKRTSDGRFTRVATKEATKPLSDLISETKPKQAAPPVVDMGGVVTDEPSAPLVDMAPGVAGASMDTKTEVDMPQFDTKVDRSTPPPVDMASQPVDLGEVTLQDVVTMGDTQVEIDVGTAELTEVTIDGKTSVQASTATKVPVKTSRTRYDLRTAKKPLSQEGYAYWGVKHMTPDEAKDRNLVLSNDVELTLDRHKAIRDAAKKKARAIESVLEDKTAYGDFNYPGEKTVIPGLGTREYAIHLSDRDLLGVIEGIAYRASLDPSESEMRELYNTFVEVDVFDTLQDQHVDEHHAMESEQFKMHTNLPLEDIARAFDIQESDFDFRVIGATHYDSEGSEGVTDTDGDIARIAGHYDLSRESTRDADSAVRTPSMNTLWVRTHMIEPEDTQAWVEIRDEDE